jgi:hypothetical protein
VVRTVLATSLPATTHPYPAGEKEAHVDTVFERLIRQSFLFDDPGAYEAGVRDAFDVLSSPTHAEDERRLIEAMQSHPSAGMAHRLHARRDGVREDPAA